MISCGTEKEKTMNQTDERDFFVDKSDDGLRLDIYLTEQTELTRSHIKKLIRDDLILINGTPASKSGIIISSDDRIHMSVPVAERIDIVPENIPLDVVYEDGDLIVVNKPKDMVIHPAPGHPCHTLVNALLYHCKGDLSGINGEIRPGIVHRIDKDTTGLIVACKNDTAHQSLASQFAVHSISRRYQAVVCDNLTNDDGTIDHAIARDLRDRKRMQVCDESKGRHAVTHYHVIDHLNKQYNHIECRLETGRTHQIRVHMASIRHPLLGDPVYGREDARFKDLRGQVLHAKSLGFIHPASGQDMEFDSELPPYFVSVLERIKKL